MKPLEERIGVLLREKKLTMSAAESCTGGRIGDKITNVAGSSEYFLGSAVAYSNEAKTHILGVSHDSLKRYGAVSEQVAREMARGSRKAFGSDIGISTTGIAGPTGGSSEKPIGLVWFALSNGTTTIAEKKVFSGDRLKIKEQAAIHAIEMVVNFVQQE